MSTLPMYRTHVSRITQHLPSQSSLFSNSLSLILLNVFLKPKQILPGEAQSIGGAGIERVGFDILDDALVVRVCSLDYVQWDLHIGFLLNGVV